MLPREEGLQTLEMVLKKQTVTHDCWPASLVKATLDAIPSSPTPRAGPPPHGFLHIAVSYSVKYSGDDKTCETSQACQGPVRTQENRRRLF